MKRIIALALILTLLISCKTDDDNGPICCVQPIATKVIFNFSQNWDGDTVNSSDFNTTQYTNANGEILTISRIRYLLSHFELVNANGESFPLNGYNLVDMSKPYTLSFETNYDNNSIIPNGIYTLKLVYGFNEEENIDGAYPDLNSVSWNWPTMLGGGYHFLQFDGMFNVDTAIPSPFNYHNGTAKVSDNVFEQNFVAFEFSTEIHIQSGSPVIDIKMNLAELFKNPIIWDLNTYSTSLMPNYDAQKMMQQNIGSVFTIEQLQ
jgi:hypothetical protein